MSKKKYDFNQSEAQQQLNNFFKGNRSKLNSFGKTVNQTFEAYVFAEVIKWYKSRGWSVKIINPKIGEKEYFYLKFNTRGKPSNYSYALCQKDSEQCQIRHNLRVNIKKHFKKRANICCDISIINNLDLNNYSSDDAIDNVHLKSFGEVKHMSGFAELLASFIGLVHELQPNNLKRIRIKNKKEENHISPFLFLSGILYPTANGIRDSIKRRKYNVDVYYVGSSLNS